MAGKICDVCGYRDEGATIASSRLGAVSFSYCRICVSLGAEPRMEGMGNYLTFNRNLDSYVEIDKEDEPVVINLKSEEELLTRNEVIEHLKLESIEGKGLEYSVKDSGFSEVSNIINKVEESK